MPRRSPRTPAKLFDRLGASAQRAAVAAGRSDQGDDSQLQRLAALVQVNRSLTSQLSLNDIFQQILQAAISVTPAADAGALYVYDPERRMLIAQEVVNLGPGLLELELEPNEGMSGRTFQKQQACMYPNSAAVADTLSDVPEERLRRYREARSGQPWAQAGISAPLNYRGQTLGVVTLQNLHTPHVFSEFDLELLDALAQSAAIAIVNARLFEAEHANRVRLETLNTESGRQRELLERQLRIRNGFAAVMREGAALPAVALRLARLCGGDAYILDAIYQVRAAEPSLATRDLRDIDPASYDEIRTALRHAARQHAVEVLQLTPQRTLLISPVFAGVESLGYVVLDLRDQVPDEINNVAVDSAALICMAPFLTERALVEAETRRHEELVHQLLGGSVPASAPGLKSFAPPIVLAVGSMSSVHQEEAHAARALLALVTLARGNHGVDGNASFVTTRGGYIVLLWAGAAAVPPNPCGYLTQLARRFGQMEPGWQVSFAVGGQVENLAEMGVSFQEARMALELRRSSHPDEPCFTVQGLGAYRFILRSASGSEARELCDRVLGKVQEHDSAHGAKILSTFRTYLACNSSLKATADALAVHPHTIQYRLDRLQDLSGMKLAVAEEPLERVQSLAFSEPRLFASFLSMCCCSPFR